MASTVHRLFYVDGLGPGKSHRYVWCNIPDGTAYTVDAIPTPGVIEAGVTEVEVTRFSHRLRVEFISSPDNYPEPVFHRDVLLTLENVGDNTLSCDVYLVVFE